jgi:signal transduction histidine kinase
MIQWGIVFSQQHDGATLKYADSLQRVVDQSPNDSIKIERLLNLSFFWSDRDSSRAFHYILEAQKVMGAKPSDYQKGLISHFMANVIYSHNPEKAKAYYMQADRYLATNTSPTSYAYRSKAWSNYGTLLQQQDSSSRFMDIIIEKALPYARLAGDSIAVGNHLQNIGLLLGNVTNYEKADTYYEQAINTLSKFPKAHEDKLTVFVNASKNSILNADFKKARTYLDSAAVQLARIPHSTYAPYYYRSEGVYYRKTGQKSKALRHFHQGLASAKSLSDEYALRDLNFEIYATYRDFNEYANAKKYLTIANRYEPYSNFHNRLLHQWEMANTEFQLGNYKTAFEKMKAYALSKDTLYEENLALKILDLEKKYQTIEKENQILKLQDANQKQQSAIDENKLLITILIAGLTIALVVTYFSWKLVQSNRRALVQNEKLHQEELFNLKQREQLQQFSSILQGQEEERNRIARDLHDDLGGLLAGIKLRLSAIANKGREKTSTNTTEIESVIHELDHSVDELRRIARNMMPESLLYMGLKPALADLCKYMDTPTTSVKFQSFDLSTSYRQPVLIGVYRIMQELLNNAIKHAEATQIIVQCSESDNYLFLAVEDDGCGFDLSSVMFKGLGLKNIENRVALLHGKLETISKPGQGTTVNIEIPV